MARPSNVELYLRGESVKLRPEQELELLDRLVTAIHEPADSYEPVYKQWRRTCRYARKGKLAKDSQEYLDAKAEMQAAKKPLHDVLVRLVTFVAQDVSEQNKETARAKLQEIMKRPCVVQAIVSVPGWNRLKKQISA